MKEIAIMPHSEKSAWKANATLLLRALEPYGAHVMMDREFKGEFDDLSRVSYVNLPDVRKKLDLVITLGGDGTIIRASKYAAESSIPLLGINIGHMGYLAELDTSELSLLDKIFSGDYFYDTRAMCDVTVKRDGAIIKEDLALNDVVLTKGMISRPVPFEVFADSTYINAYLADGIIIATPTGSTAYSLSAGGPIMEPTAESIVLTPIAPHTLSSRPIIMSNTREMRVVVGDLSFKDAYVTSDGTKGFCLTTGDEITVRKSEKTTKLIRIKERGFYDILSEKM